MNDDRHVTYIVGDNGREFIEVDCPSLGIQAKIHGWKLSEMRDLIITWHRRQHEEATP